MKFFIVGDIHASDKAPSTRKDNYLQSVLDKIDFINAKAEELKPDAILQAGDIFHKKIPFHNSYLLTSQLIEKFEGKNWIAIPGNHDIFGTINNLNQQPIHVLKRSGVMQLFIDGSEHADFTEGNFSVSVSGTAFSEKLDDKSAGNLYNLSFEETSDYKIGIFHQMILPDGHTFFSDFINFEDLKDINCDIIIDGHYHDGFTPSVQFVHGKYFVNPGSISRGSSEQANLDKKPKFLMLELLEGQEPKFTEIFIPVKPASEVFDIVEVERKKENKAIKDFIKNLSDFEVESLTSETPEGIKLILSNMGAEPEVVTLADKYLTMASEKTF